MRSNMFGESLQGVFIWSAEQKIIFKIACLLVHEGTQNKYLSSSMH